jgi:hypothetical protein
MTQAVDTKFNFKARKIVDEQGKELGKAKKQPALVVAIPVPTDAEVVAYLSDPDEVDGEGKKVNSVGNKVRDLLRESFASIIRDQAKSQLDEVIDSFGLDDSKTVGADAIDFDKLSLEYIATLPPAQRGTRAISDEDFEAFFADYLAVMVATTGKSEIKIMNHIGHFKKPLRLKNSKDALSLMVDQLDVYLATSANIEETGEVANRLRGKFSKWLTEDDKLDLEAL